MSLNGTELYTLKQLILLCKFYPNQKQDREREGRMIDRWQDGEWT